MNRYVLLLLAAFTAISGQSQTVYTADASVGTPSIRTGYLKLGSHTDPSGNTLDANNLYFLKNGKPWYPVMGEIHFSRFPKDKWEESILKMKAAGIDVIASYVFWIYHEEEEGKFDWTGNKDLRAFAELCKKHHVYFFVRIGPWCHGEVRNGGFPDWLLKRGNTRRNDPAYLASVQKLYDQVAKQLGGLYFKDGGPVIGAQIENEFRFNNPTGLQHMLTLKSMAIRAGIDVPFYTATGWPGSNQDQNELMPVWGAYPEAPWDKKTTRLALSENYVFSALRNDPAIGSDLLGTRLREAEDKGYRYPYATAEMGGGNQITYHRRPIIKPEDVTALTYVKTGAGANLMGYYMFHGGSNPIGKLSTLQESKATKYPNDYTLINYDFQSPLGEWGELRPSYRGFKVIHMFLNDFGDKLVQEYPYFPDQKPSSPGDNSVLRFSVRAKDESGFVFISNFQRQLEMKDFGEVKFRIKLPGKELTFPRNPVTIRKGLQAVLPFNMDLDGIKLNYATAQPLCRIEGKEPLYVFFAPEGISPEYAFSLPEKTNTTAKGATLSESGTTVLANKLQPGTGCLLTFLLPGGKKVMILTLSRQQALDGWKAAISGTEHFFISSGELTFPGDGITVQSEENPELQFSAFPALPKAFTASGNPQIKSDGIFTSYLFKTAPSALKATTKEVTDISDYQNKGNLLPSDNRDPAINVPASIGPQYQTNLTPVAGAKYYEITVPQTFAKLNEAYLRIRYTGDTGAAYLNGRLVADDFYSGLPMTIALREIFTANKPGGKLLLQIIPLTDERAIYFEDGIREPLAGKPAASLISAEIIPKYELRLSPGSR
jgi:hypothetical protein